jgi:hypothetical protein
LKGTIVYLGELTLEGIDAVLNLGQVAACDDEVGRMLRGLVLLAFVTQAWADRWVFELTNASAVVNPTPPWFTPVTRTFFPWMP